MLMRTVHPTTVPASKSVDERLRRAFKVGTKEYLAAQRVVAKLIERPQGIIDDDKVAEEVKIDRRTVQTVKSKMRGVGFPIEKGLRVSKKKLAQKALSTTTPTAPSTLSSYSTPSKTSTGEVIETAHSATAPQKTTEDIAPSNHSQTAHSKTNPETSPSTQPEGNSSKTVTERHIETPQETKGQVLTIIPNH